MNPLSFLKFPGKIDTYLLEIDFDNYFLPEDMVMCCKSISKVLGLKQITNKHICSEISANNADEQLNSTTKKYKLL